MSGNTPRKFSEKIAIMERKQNEDVNQFDEIMREVRSITTTNPSNEIPIATLHPPTWPHNHFGGSLPNVAQLPSYQPQWPQWEPQQFNRSRSPDSMHQHPAHYHPYVRGPHRSPDRVPPLHPHYIPYPQQHTLQPPDQWNQINRARSDPAIHNGVQMAQQHQQMMAMQAHHQQYMQMQPGPSGMHADNIPSPMSMQQQSPFNMQPVMNTSPINSPNMLHGYQYPNGSPMQSPHGSPMGSQIMLDERNTPLMELSPPGMHDPNQEVGSLPNLQQMPPVTNYHATVGQRHSTGGQCGRLVPGPTLTPESQSAPTSPGNVIDPAQQPQWPATRTFSNSPELYDIPRVVLTNPDGADGHHLECYNDGQLHNNQSPEASGTTNGNVPNQQQGLYQ